MFAARDDFLVFCAVERRPSPETCRAYRPEDETATGAAVDVALELGEEEARRASEIWDELVRIEQNKFYDADRLTKWSHS